MPIGVIETWEGALALCTDEAVGSLERAVCQWGLGFLSDYSGETSGKEGRTLTIWPDPVPIRSAPVTQM
jgi:hypothetical protein